LDLDMSQSINRNMPAPQNFTLFCELPVEPHLQIWRAALPGPRLVEIFHHHTRSPPPPSNDDTIFAGTLLLKTEV
jgi:hypothetical protein